MIGFAFLALTQAAINAPVPVVRDAPPAMLFAAYDQCLGREVERRLLEPISAEEVFDRSQVECAYLLDAYVAKVTSTIVATNIDYQREKARLVTSLRAAVVPRITERRVSSEPPTEIAPGS